MIRSFKFRIYPSKKQQFNLNFQFDLSKNAYNQLLEKAKEKYKSEKKFLTKFEMNKYLSEFKEMHSEYQIMHSQVLQNISDRLSKA